MTALDVPPGNTSNDLGDRGDADTEVVCDHLIRSTAQFYVSDALNGDFIEFCESLACAIRMTRLSAHVGLIVGIGANKQVIRIYAAPIVAAMQYHETVGDGPMRSFVGKPVRLYALSADSYALSIAVIVQRPLPLVTAGL